MQGQVKESRNMSVTWDQKIHHCFHPHGQWNWENAQVSMDTSVPGQF